MGSRQVLTRARASALDGTQGARRLVGDAIDGLFDNVTGWSVWDHAAGVGRRARQSLSALSWGPHGGDEAIAVSERIPARLGTETRPSDFLALGDGEFIQADKVDDRLAVIWTSDESVVDAVSSALAEFGEPADTDRGEILLDHDPADTDRYGEGTSREVVEYVLSEGSGIASLSLDVGEVRVSWCATMARIADEPAHAECALTFRSNGAHEVPKQLEAFVARTGTKRVSGHSDVLWKMKLVAKGA